MKRASVNKINVLHLFSGQPNDLFLEYFLKEQEVLLEHRAFTAEQQNLFFGVLSLAKTSEKPVWGQSEIYFEKFGRFWPLGILRLAQYCKKHNIHAVATYGETLGLLTSLILPFLGNPLLIHHPLAPLRGFFAGWPKAFLGRRVTKRGYVDGPLHQFLQDPKGFAAPLLLHPDTFQNARPPQGTEMPERVIFEMECLYSQKIFWRREKNFLVSTFQKAIPQVRRKFRKSLFRFQKPHRKIKLGAGELKVSVFLCRHFPNEKTFYHLLHCLKIGKPFLIFSEEIYPSVWREKFEPLLYPLEKEVCETVLAETITNPSDLFSLLEKTKHNLSTPSDFGGFLEKSAYQTQTALEHATQPRLAQLHRRRQHKAPPQTFTDDAFFSLLRCPRCFQSLTPQVTHVERNMAWSGSLSCRNCDTHFPLTRGIPQLLIDPTGPLEKPLAKPDYLRVNLFKQSALSAFELSLLATLNPLAAQAAHLGGIGLQMHAGNGVLLEHLAFFGGRFIGLDVPEHLEKTQNALRDFPNVRLVATHPHQIPLADQTFSLAIDIHSMWDCSHAHLPLYQKYFNQLSGKLIAEAGQLHLLSFAPPQIPRIFAAYWEHLRYVSEGLPLWLQKALALGCAHGQDIWDRLQEKPAGRLPLLKAMWLGLLQSSEFSLPDEKCFRDLSRQARLHAVNLHEEIGHLALTARK